VDRLERLVNLVAALLDADRPLTRAELRRRVGGYSADDDAFRRNFERDKDVLRQMGMPLITESLGADNIEDQAGYRIPRERYELPDPGLSEAELAALRLAASAVQLDATWGREATSSALRKLAAGGGGGTWPAPGGGLDGPTPAPVAPAVRLAELDGGEAVAGIFGAIAQRRRLRFTYHGEGRIVDPWRLSYRRGQWYLTGFDHLRDGERVYRVDRIEGAVDPAGEPGAFDRPGGPATTPAPPWRLGDGPEVRVQVRVDADQAPWAIASAGEEAVTSRRADGGVDLELAVTNRAALRSWILGFLHHAEILGPPAERDALRRWLQALADPALADPAAAGSTARPARRGR
jgi:proteasome accessory factor B